jgi:hypothetical protein
MITCLTIKLLTKTQFTLFCDQIFILFFHSVRIGLISTEAAPTPPPSFIPRACTWHCCLIKRSFFLVSHGLVKFMP